MAQKSIKSVGVEFDNCGIRAARVVSSTYGKNISYSIDNLQEIKGKFVKDDDLVTGLGQIKESISLSPKDRIVACVSGKQVYAVQMPFNLLPENEMANAIKFEIRKNIPFETASATIDYQILETREQNSAVLLVTAVANSLLNRLNRTLDRAGIKPWIVDVMPTAVANAFWAADSDPVNISARVIAHFSPDVCTVVIDGNTIPFYTRSIYFNAEELYGQQEPSVADKDRERRLSALGDELSRSLAYYEKTYHISNFSSIYLIGDYLQSSELLSVINSHLGLKMEASTLLNKLRSKIKAPPGKFDVALGLAMRTEKAQTTFS